MEQVCIFVLFQHLVSERTFGAMHAIYTRRNPIMSCIGPPRKGKNNWKQRVVYWWIFRKCVSGWHLFLKHTGMLFLHLYKQILQNYTREADKAHKLLSLNYVYASANKRCHETYTAATWQYSLGSCRRNTRACPPVMTFEHKEHDRK